MGKINNIGSGWFKSVVHTKQEQGKAEARKKICGGCDENKELMGFNYCGKCYCPISKKVYSPMDKCPLGKW